MGGGDRLCGEIIGYQGGRGVTQIEEVMRRLQVLERWQCRVDERLEKGAKTMAVLTEKNMSLTRLEETLQKLDNKLDELCLKFAVMSGSGQGKNALGEGIVKYGGWALAIASFLYSVLK